jgi:hypothetical protein
MLTAPAQIVNAALNAVGGAARIVGAASGAAATLLTDISNDPKERLPIAEARMINQKVESLRAVTAVLGGVTTLPTSPEMWTMLNRAQAREAVDGAIIQVQTMFANYTVRVNDPEFGQTELAAASERGSKWAEMLDQLSKDKDFRTTQQQTPAAQTRAALTLKPETTEILEFLEPLIASPPTVADTPGQVTTQSPYNAWAFAPTYSHLSSRLDGIMANIGDQPEVNALWDSLGEAVSMGPGAIQGLTMTGDFSERAVPVVPVMSNFAGSYHRKTISGSITWRNPATGTTVKNIAGAVMQVPIRRRISRSDVSQMIHKINFKTSLLIRSPNASLDKNLASAIPSFVARTMIIRVDESEQNPVSGRSGFRFNPDVIAVVEHEFRPYAGHGQLVGTAGVPSISPMEVYQSAVSARAVSSPHQAIYALTWTDPRIVEHSGIGGTPLWAGEYLDGWKLCQAPDASMLVTTAGSPVEGVKSVTQRTLPINAALSHRVARIYGEHKAHDDETSDDSVYVWKDLVKTVAQSRDRGLSLTAVALNNTTNQFEASVGIGTLSDWVRIFRVHDDLWLKYIQFVRTVMKITLPGTPEEFLQSRDIHGFADSRALITRMTELLISTPNWATFAH